MNGNGGLQTVNLNNNRVIFFSFLEIDRSANSPINPNPNLQKYKDRIYTLANKQNKYESHTKKIKISYYYYLKQNCEQKASKSVFVK